MSRFVHCATLGGARLLVPYAMSICLLHEILSSVTAIYQVVSQKLQVKIGIR